MPESLRIVIGRTLIRWGGLLLYAISKDYLGSSEECKDKRIFWRIESLEHRKKRKDAR